MYDLNLNNSLTSEMYQQKRLRVRINFLFFFLIIKEKRQKITVMMITHYGCIDYEKLQKGIKLF